MSRPSDPWRLLFAAAALTVNAGVTAVPAGWKTHALPFAAPGAQPPSLAGVREALQWIAREWKDEQTQRAFASDCDPPALRWYWACDGTQ